MFDLKYSNRGYLNVAMHFVRTAALLFVFAVGTPTHAQNASPAEGQKLAAQGIPPGVPACAGCHGMKGEGSATFPRLAGTGQAYLLAQLDAFAAGSRKSSIMQPFAQQMSPAQRDAVATYYSRLPAPFVTQDKTSAPAGDAGVLLATRGRWTSNIPACAQCHGPGGSGVGTQFPPLAGLPAVYITRQLQAWKSGERPPGPLELMPAVARKLSDLDMNQVAAYYAGLTAEAPATPAPAASVRIGKRP